MLSGKLPLYCRVRLSDRRCTNSEESLFGVERNSLICNMFLPKTFKDREETVYLVNSIRNFKYLITEQR